MVTINWDDVTFDCNEETIPLIKKLIEDITIKLVLRGDIYPNEAFKRAVSTVELLLKNIIDNNDSILEEGSKTLNKSSKMDHILIRCIDHNGGVFLESDIHEDVAEPILKILSS